MNKEGKNFVVNINSGTIIKTIVILAIASFLYLVSDLILVVLASVVIASAIEPLVKWFAKARIARLPAVIITYAGLFSAFIGLFYFFVPTLLNETLNFTNAFPRYFDSSAVWNPLSKEKTDQSQKIAQNVSQGLAESKEIAKGISAKLETAASQPQDKSAEPQIGSKAGLSDLITGFQKIFSHFSSGFVNTVSAVFGGVLSFTLIVVLSFYLAVQEDGVVNFLKVVTPAKNEKYVIGLWKRSQQKIGYWMQGQILLALIVGVLLYLGLTILGVKNAILLSVFAAFFEIIPLFGPVIAAIPAVLLSFADGGLTAGLLVVGLYLIIQQFENHLIYPLVVKKIVGVSPILVILALVIGYKLAGFLGVLLSVPIAAAVTEYFRDIVEGKITEKMSAEEAK
ncbi:MAG: AI-2E family transporter [Patescibacteria group bacterium]|nr:AI-2E family transporter [Patescibacteria group bacterium]MDE2218111.1 AI-2E family transporter [Patescibacteria group bacterium]